MADGASVPAPATIKPVRSTPATGTPAAPGDLSGSLAGFGLMLPTFDPYRQGSWRLIEAAARAEELGFDSGWAGDHLQYHAPVLEPYGALAAVAARTRSLRLGFGVMLLALRSPVWVAKQLATLDALAPGLERWCLIGDAATVAEGLAAHRAAGVDGFVLHPASPDPLAQLEPLAAVRSLLP